MLHQHKRDNKKTKAKILTQQKKAKQNKTNQNKTNTKFLHKYLSTVSNVQQYFDKKSRILNDDNNYDSISTKQFWILDNRFVFCINKQINNSQLTQTNSKQCCIHHIYIHIYIYRITLAILSELCLQFYFLCLQIKSQYAGLSLSFIYFAFNSFFLFLLFYALLLLLFCFVCELFSTLVSPVAAFKCAL